MDTMANEKSRYEAFLREFAKETGEIVVTHMYTGHQSPYRWEFRSEDPLTWLGSLTLDGPDILRMQGMSETDQRDFLRSRFQDALAAGVVA
jgi:hypothetical protein